MNNYELKQAERKLRQADRADRLEAEANRLYNQARSMADVIPFGQPILVGHHSEKRDRNYRNRIHNTFGKAFELDKQAKEARERAETVSNAISSDDPDAPDKLREKIAALEATQERHKAANKLVRKNDRVGLAAMGYTESAINNLFTPDFCGRIGYPGYDLTNRNGNIKRLKDRLAALERRATAEPKADIIKGDGWVVSEDVDENRLLITFDAIPPVDVRTKLKQNGFKWSPSRGAWGRMLNDGARLAAQWALGYDQ